jgi:hypothetical protein
LRHLTLDRRITATPFALAAEVANSVRSDSVSKDMLDPILRAYLAPSLKPSFKAPLSDYLARPHENLVLQAPETTWAYFTYQWKKDGLSIPGATSPQLNVAAQSPGQYSLVASNAFGTS